MSGVKAHPDSRAIVSSASRRRRARHRVTNVVRGAASPITFATFDYRYDTSPTGAGDSSDVAEQTVVHMRSPQLSVPPFVLAPENVLHKIGNLLGYEDIDFDDTPEFSGRYFLRAKGSEVRVRETFTVPVRTFFEGRRPLNVEASDDQLLVYYDDRLRDPAELRSFIDEALEIARQFMR